MKKIKDFMKLYKVKIRKINKLMGYNPIYIGEVLNGHHPATKQFKKLLMLILTEIVHEKITEMKKDLEEIEKISKEE